MLLASAGCVAESGHNFVQNKQRAVSMRQVADPLQISIARQDATHVCHDRLGDHGGKFSSLLAENTFQRFQVIPRCKHHVVEYRRRNALGIWKASGILSRAELVRRMAMPVPTVRVAPAAV